MSVVSVAVPQDEHIKNKSYISITDHLYT